MQTLGINSVRWFVFTDARAGITFDAAGLPTGIDDFVFKDLNAALEIAQKHNIAINFVLLDFHLIWDAQVENGVQLGGHTAMIATPRGSRRSFITFSNPSSSATPTTRPYFPGR